MTVIFTLENVDNTTIDLEFEPFDHEHSKLWMKGIKEFYNKNIPLSDTDRIFAFNPFHQDIQRDILDCNVLIDKINNQAKKDLIQKIRLNNLQDDVNNVHNTWVDEKSESISGKDLSELNAKIHGLEIKIRHQTKKEIKPQGQIFVELYGTRYDIPENSYEYFTIKNTYGYCYNNYSHVGRHILEVFNSNDVDIPANQIVPHHQISGSSRLWFGNTTPNEFVEHKMNLIEEWYNTNNLKEKTNFLR
jgi:hypothetical protein